MTGFAFLRHRSLVGLGMAGAAVSLIGHIRADFVASGTILGQAGVPPFEGKPGLGGVVEILRVERPDIGVGALMLLVARFTIARDFAVNPFFGTDPVGHRLMAGQAAAGVNLLALGVALPAVGFAFQ